MHTTNYSDTLILVAEDCPKREGTLPARAGTVAALQHGLLSRSPYEMTSDDLLWRVELLRRSGLLDNDSERERYFSKGRACLRASPLVKSFGWGLHHDGDGRVALVGMETDAYRRLVDDPSVTKLAGMRSRRP